MKDKRKDEVEEGNTIIVNIDAIDDNVFIASVDVISTKVSNFLFRFD